MGCHRIPGLLIPLNNFLITYVLFIAGFDNFLKRGSEHSKENPDKNLKQEESTSEQEHNGKSAEETNGQAGEEKPSRPRDDESETKKWTGGGFGPFRSQHNSNSNNTRNDSEGGNGGSGVPPNFSSTMLTAILLLGLTYIMIRNDDETATPTDFSTREITWNDFCNYLLETGQVEKIVVTNNRTMAKVFLKAGSPGLPHHQTRHFRYSDRRQNSDGGTDTLFQDSTQISDGSTPENFGSSTVTSLPHGKNYGPQHQIVYRFAM